MTILAIGYIITAIWLLKTGKVLVAFGNLMFGLALAISVL